MTTFDELFAEHNLTPEERKALVMHLATLRAQKTVAALQDCPHAAPLLRHLPRETMPDWLGGLTPEVTRGRRPSR